MYIRWSDRLDVFLDYFPHIPLQVAVSSLPFNFVSAVRIAYIHADRVVFHLLSVIVATKKIVQILLFE
jgi:hypothetical protein